MEETRMGVEAMRAEQAGIDRAIEETAVEEDAGAFLTLSMRKAALPKIIREERARPVRERIEALEGQLEDLEAERQRVLAGDFEVPQHKRGDLDQLMLRNQQLGAISARSSRIGHHLDQARKELAVIEGGVA